MAKKEIIAVLGAQNSSDGTLSGIAMSRLNYCLAAYKKGVLVLCTGGWGDHFNTTETAHAVYAKNYLTEHGIPVDAFLKDALSNNSVDDAVKIKKIILEIADVNLIVVTSDYHKERVSLIFIEILSDYPCTFIGVYSHLDGDELNRLIQHEQEAIASILRNGLYY